MKIVFLQNKGGNYGGVWQVNRMVGEALINKGYEVSIVSLREDHFGLTLEHDPRLNVITINKKDIWHTYYGSDFKESLRKLKLITLTKQICHRIRNNFRLKNDQKELTKYLDNYKPDYIVVSQYQVLNFIDEKYLPITYCEQHGSFAFTKSNPDNIKVFMNYQNKIKGFIWLSKAIMEEAIKFGFTNSTYIYNAVRFKEERKANVINNKKLVTISRISEEKRIDLMIEIMEEIFSDIKYKDWVLEIYGDGEEYDNVKKLIHSSQIRMMGSTDKPQEVLLTSSINLNTSEFEGFPMSILEAYECGVPTVSLKFGEAVNELIDDTKTGYICIDKEEFIRKLKVLMDDSNLLEEMSINSKEYVKNFKIDIIVNDWIKLFNDVK